MLQPSAISRCGMAANTATSTLAFQSRACEGRPCGHCLLGQIEGVALGFALGKFLQVAGAADVSRGHAQVGHVVGFLLGVDVDVTVNTADFLELFVRAQPVHGAQVLLDVFQFGFLVVDGVVRLQVADLVQVGMRAFLPGIDPYRRFVRVAFDAFLPLRHFFHGGRRLVEGGRVKVHAHTVSVPSIWPVSHVPLLAQDPCSAWSPLHAIPWARPIAQDSALCTSLWGRWESSRMPTPPAAPRMPA